MLMMVTDCVQWAVEPCKNQLLKVCEIKRNLTSSYFNTGKGSKHK